MEPEAEKIIQEKLRLLENTTVTWNKEWVWSRIETPVKRKIGIIWYAAASLVAGALTISIYLASLQYEVEMMDQISRLETLMDRIHNANITAATPEENCTQDLKESSTQQDTPNQKPNRVLSGRSEMIKTSISDASLEANLPELPFIEIKQPTFVLANENSPLIIEHENTVKPIVGKLPVVQHSMAATKSKEIKITVFQSEDYKNGLMTDARDYKILTAHFKNN